MIDIKYFSGLYPQLPVEFLLQLDDNFRRLSRTTGWHLKLANATNGAVSYQLPDGTLYPLDHLVTKVDSSANVVTLYAATGQTIRGNPSYDLTFRYAAVYVTFCRETADWVPL